MRLAMPRFRGFEPGAHHPARYDPEPSTIGPMNAASIPFFIASRAASRSLCARKPAAGMSSIR
jgi:hypothetical protein